MRICSWNINGLRSLRQPLRNVLEQLDSDIICFQETKVTRQALAETYARVDGYHTFYSWSRLREGYSGVAIFCKTSLTPIRAEEGLAGKLHSNLDDSLGGEYPSMDENDLLAIDREGRAIMTEHELEDGTSLALINVYCPRVDREKPERLTYKLNFFSAIEQRAKCFLERGCRVIVVGDFNVSHKPIDTCDPGDDINYFISSPSRLWFSKFIENNIFIDTFRYLHPDQREAYTCWETLSNARVNNYGVRIDYIFCDGAVSKLHLVDCQHRIEIESSDHCPVIGEFNFIFSDRSAAKPPSICTKFWSEFKGTQMKLNQFMIKTKRIRDEEIDVDGDKKQQTNEIKVTSKRTDVEAETSLAKTNPPTEEVIETSMVTQRKPIVKPPLKKVKSDQSSLFQHFKRTSQPKIVVSPRPCASDNPPAKNTEVINLSNDEIAEKPKKTATWNQIFRPPTPPPFCSGHKERCVIRQVKDTSSNNWGRYFYVCSRANGASNNPQARCDHFSWKENKKKTASDN
ncbi:unnamed protein product [Rotaria magnacalcarata]|uniref:DNA-(apurinic or apyrimidinic site) endonuclease n=4 Tax=Rotaria magnacalcarata TaxID=392030 RepID=A0A819BFA7_9BILA|nr:unnamed protein product [Rotaria magnacalcarata]CAF2083513.1 unnamed protein product [Rotaria magnacalcarata]CAF3802387.1 unnamed protein product [Rotaria magnacalcarata]CAF4025875.1 unnamed protein product [Rotaria magnacalcarata]